MPATLVWCDGRWCDTDEPVVTALDRGLTGGLGVYESCAVLDGKVFAPTRHLARLAHSAAVLGLPSPELGTLRGVLDEVAAAGAWPYGRLRVTITAGRSDAGHGVTTVVGSSASRVTSMRVVRAPWVRNERAATRGAKATSTADSLVAARFAWDAGADEALLANTRDELCEGCTSNVLVEVGGELLTPPLSSGCLGGVTRQLLLEWSVDWGLPVREQTLPWTVLDEVVAGKASLALSSTTRTVVPVVTLDGLPTAAAPLARRAARLFDERRRQDLDP